MNEPCGCCAGVEIITPVSVINPPGLRAISYRVGTHATFYETMLARLSNLALDVPSVHGTGNDRLYPLRPLTTRDPGDPSIALLDAWALVADVLTFYQERIANEGYLPTAIERRSIVELAHLVGYRARPGVAASVYLAFTVAAGFRGELPAGTRAQSIPGTGENPQFFETSDVLTARDTWNALKPRLTRPQVITRATAMTLPTSANVVDAVYLEGIATNLKASDALLFLLGTRRGAGLQHIRTIESVDPQPDDKRTQVTLVETGPEGAEALELLIAKGRLFPGNAVAQEVVEILTTLKASWKGTADAIGQSLFRGAAAQIRARQDVAARRKFTRLSAWIGHVICRLEEGPKANGADTQPPNEEDEIECKVMPSSLAASPLANLLAISGSLALPPSSQPANALHLGRSVAQSFAPQADVKPRLIAAFKPAAATALYQAWSAVDRPVSRLQVHALRAKATLFAGSYPGPATITPRPVHGASLPAAAPSTVSFSEPPTINSAWASLMKKVPSTDIEFPSAVALDATYDRIKPGSWIVIDRPELKVEDDHGRSKTIITGNRTVTYHQVKDVRVSNMDTGTGFAAKVTLLTLDAQWLLDVAATDKVLLAAILDSHEVLRDTLVHAQSEPLDLVEEPLEADVGQDSIALDAVYDGLEPGRWIIVSGNRTDIPNVSGTPASELAMIAGVSQASEASPCAQFPSNFVPFLEHCYTTAANANGDHLVVGRIERDVLNRMRSNHGQVWPPLPEIPDQQYCGQVEIAPGVYVNAYVPTDAERKGRFPDFDGLLVDPSTGQPYPDGAIPRVTASASGPEIFAWRISAPKLHTVLQLASPLAYRYDAASVTIYGNVAHATHGQTVGEVLGDGDGSKPFQSFPLRQKPLTHVSAPTPAGAESTLAVRVNEIKWHETGTLAGAGPRDRTFVTRTADNDETSVQFGNGERGARLPTGIAAVKAVYRYGIGRAGNVKAWQISQLATQPLGAQAVVNPLPASGGADRDGADQVRRNAPLAVTALDRLVSVKDYADFARTYAGIAKASAVRLSDGRRRLVHVTVAGTHDIAIDENSDLYRNLVTSLETFGDPHLPIQVCARRLKLLVISAGVRILTDYLWESVEPKIRAAVLDHFGFERRDLSQSAFRSEAVGLMQGIEGVAYVDVDIFDSVAEGISAGELARLGATLKLNAHVLAEAAQANPSPPPARPGADPRLQVLPAELVFLTPDIPEMLILNQIGG